MARRSEASKRSTRPGLVTIKEAAGVLGVSEVTLRRWDDAGKFPARRHPINGYRLYSLDRLARLRADIHGGR
jgi:DNA-binding transcriptional MerR regulator